MSGPAFLSRAASHGHLDLEGSPLDFLASPHLSNVLVLTAFGEIVADKLSIAPSRTSPPVLLWRAASGGLVGAASFASDGRRTTTGVVLGSSAAIVAAVAGEWLRAMVSRKTGLPDPVAALAEDAVVLVVGSRALRDVR